MVWFEEFQELSQEEKDEIERDVIDKLREDAILVVDTINYVP